MTAAIYPFPRVREQSYADSLLTLDHRPMQAARRAVEERIEHLLDVAATTTRPHLLTGFEARRERRRRDALAAELWGLREALRGFVTADRLIAAAFDHYEGGWKGTPA